MNDSEGRKKNTFSIPTILVHYMKEMHIHSMNDILEVKIWLKSLTLRSLCLQFSHFLSAMCSMNFLFLVLSKIEKGDFLNETIRPSFNC